MDKRNTNLLKQKNGKMGRKYRKNLLFLAYKATLINIKFNRYYDSNCNIYSGYCYRDHHFENNYSCTTINFSGTQRNTQT